MARRRETHSAGTRAAAWLGVGGVRRDGLSDSIARATPETPTLSAPNSTGASLLYLVSEESGRMAGLAASALPLSTGSSPLPATVRGLTRHPLLKVAGQQPCALRRFGPARVKRCAVASRHGRQELRTSEYQFDDDEPLWLAVVREIAAGLRGLVAFLAEQPRQLKHLEWPGFRNTLRMAALTLILVAVFIVALSSVDAVLCYILSWLLRKSA